jgi:hypothetical protein
VRFAARQSFYTEIDSRLTVEVKRGNANKLGNTNESPGKSSLFLLRDGLHCRISGRLVDDEIPLLLMSIYLLRYLEPCPLRYLLLDLSGRGVQIEAASVFAA